MWPTLRLRLPLVALTVASLVLGGCDYFAEQGPVRVAVIGTNVKMSDPDKGRPNNVSQALLMATAQGLVSFDGDGQIEPGLAERWIVTDDGLSYIFRIRDAHWSNGDKVTTAHVAALLRAHISPASRNRYASEINGVASIKPMTSEVVEIRLERPLPHLLEILAQPDMALLRGGRGWGPMTGKLESGGMLLSAKQAAPPGSDEEELIADDIPPVHLVARPAAKALARYINREADVVLGGRFDTYPYVRAAGIADNRLIVDPAEGLFGLAFAHADGLLRTANVRRAISMAIDREALTASFGEARWSPLLSLRPPLEKQDAAFAPTLPSYASLSEQARIGEARLIIAAARASMDHQPVLRIALPDGPGADLLFTSVRADLRNIGLDAIKVKPTSAADLRLIDEVAPSRDPFWYARSLSCAHMRVCNSDADARLKEASASTDPAVRAALLRETEELLFDAAGYIPLAEPLRWSVTSPRSNALKPNPRARHPLNRLVTIPS